MVNIKQYLLFFLKKGEARSLNAKKNIIVSFVLSGMSILVSFLLVPLTLEYLNPTKYGIWLTLTSIIGWLSFFDIGLGNGLRNKLTEALALNDINLAKTYVSTAYATITIIMIVLYIVFLVTLPLLNWSYIFNVPIETVNDLSDVILVVFTFFSLRFIVKIIGVIFIADQLPAFNNLFEFFGSALSLIAISIITKFSKGSLLYISIVYSIAPVLVLILASFYFFKKKYRAIKPSFSKIDFNKFKDLAGLGINFFILQIAVIIIFSTDNMIITQVLGPAAVTPYNISFKYFSIPIMIFSIVVTPFWSAYTDAHAKGDLVWIKKSINRLSQTWILIFAMVIVMLLASQDFYKFWVGNDLQIPILLSILMGIFAIISTWNNIFAAFLNGLGKIKLQIYYSLFGMIINIPLSVFFAKSMNLGSSGVILATCICLSFGAILAPLQYYKLVNNKAFGIWNK